MKLKKDIVIKRVVLILFIIFCLGNIGMVFFIFQKSIKMDKQHIQAISIARKLDNEILNTRILIDDLEFMENEIIKRELFHNLDTIKYDLNKLNTIFIEEFKKVNNNDLKDFSNEYAVICNNYSELKKYIISSHQKNQINAEVLLAYYNDFNRSNQRFGQFLQRYLDDNTIIYKRQVFLTFMAILIFIVLSGAFVIYLINQLRIAERRHIQNTIDVENRERQRIAADLHDGLGAYLSSIIMSIELLAKEHENNENLVSKAKYLKQLSRLALESVEEVVNNLNPSLLARVGFFKALEKTISKINALGKTQFSIDSMYLHVKLHKSMEIILYRICMELINNALKHSQAKNAKFTFFNTKSRINITYEDNGIGFESDEIAYENNKSGLYNLSKRVESIGGYYSISSEPDKGVKISIALKL